MEIFVCKFNMLKKCKIKTKKNKKGNKKKQGENQKTSKKAKHTKVYFAFFNSNPNELCSRVPDAGGGFSPVDNNYKGGSLRER